MGAAVFRGEHVCDVLEGLRKLSLRFVADLRGDGGDGVVVSRKSCMARRIRVSFM